MSAQFRTNSSKQPYPLRQSSGVREADFREGDKNILGTPKRGFSRATPSSEVAHVKTQNRFIQSLNKRVAQVVSKEARASNKTEKDEKRYEKQERNREADQNLELANKFMERQEKIRRGENPPPVDVIVNVESGPTLPRNISESEKKKHDTQKTQENKKEENIIKTITEPQQEEKPASPAMVATDNQSSPHTEEAYAYAASPAYTTKGTEPPKPQQKPQQKKGFSLSQIALMRYPAKG